MLLNQVSRPCKLFLYFSKLLCTQDETCLEMKNPNFYHLLYSKILIVYETSRFVEIAIENKGHVIQFGLEIKPTPSRPCPSIPFQKLEEKKMWMVESSAIPQVLDTKHGISSSKVVAIAEI